MQFCNIVNTADNMFSISTMNTFLNFMTDTNFFSNIFLAYNYFFLNLQRIMDANHNCSIAFEITTSKQKSNLHMNGADHRVQAFPYHVWVCGEPQRRMELSCAFFFLLADKW